MKSQFCSRSSLNAEELGANQSTKLEIASKMMEYVKNTQKKRKFKWNKKRKNKKATLKWQLRTQKKSKKSRIFYMFLSLFFHVFYHFLQVKSQFCSRSSLNAWKTQEAREKNIKKLEELGANQSTKLEIASKMMENVLTKWKFKWKKN